MLETKDEKVCVRKFGMSVRGRMLSKVLKLGGDVGPS